MAMRGGGIWADDLLELPNDFESVTSRWSASLAAYDSRARDASRCSSPSRTDHGQRSSKVDGRTGGGEATAKVEANLDREGHGRAQDDERDEGEPGGRVTRSAVEPCPRGAENADDLGGQRGWPC